MGRCDDIQTILAQAASCPAEERAGLLDRACGGDAALRVEVESLLHSLGVAGRFLAAPTAVPNHGAGDDAVAAAARSSAQRDEAVGTRIGP